MIPFRCNGKKHPSERTPASLLCLPPFPQIQCWLPAFSLNPFFLHLGGTPYAREKNTLSCKRGGRTHSNIMFGGKGSRATLSLGREGGKCDRKNPFSISRVFFSIAPVPLQMHDQTCKNLSVSLPVSLPPFLPPSLSLSLSLSLSRSLSLPPLSL